MECYITYKLIQVIRYKNTMRRNEIKTLMRGLSVTSAKDLCHLTSSPSSSPSNYTSTPSMFTHRSLKKVKTRGARQRFEEVHQSHALTRHQHWCPEPPCGDNIGRLVLRLLLPLLLPPQQPLLIGPERSTVAGSVVGQCHPQIAHNSVGSATVQMPLQSCQRRSGYNSEGPRPKKRQLPSHYNEATQSFHHQESIIFNLIFYCEFDIQISLFFLSSSPSFSSSSPFPLPPPSLFLFSSLLPPFSPPRGEDWPPACSLLQY